MDDSFSLQRHIDDLWLMILMKIPADWAQPYIIWNVICLILCLHLRPEADLGPKFISSLEIFHDHDDIAR